MYVSRKTVLKYIFYITLHVIKPDRYNIKSDQSFFCKVPAVAYASTNAAFAFLCITIHKNTKAAMNTQHRRGFMECIYIYGAIFCTYTSRNTHMCLFTCLRLHST